jgi:divalent metal cation (Fe/Co/Zn/Cd) transporter
MKKLSSLMMGVMILFAMLEMGVESFVKQLLKQSAGINKKEKHGYEISAQLNFVADF